MRESIRSNPLVRLGTLALALGVLALLVVHGALTAGCNRTSAAPDPVVSPTNAAPPSTSAAAPADDPRMLPATKSGAVFWPQQQEKPQQAAKK